MINFLVRPTDKVYMNDIKKNAVNYILFLQNKAELDRSYYLLAELLGKINITLLPVDLDELRNLDRVQKYFIISISDSFSTAHEFQNTRKKFIDSAMALKKVMVYDISSFSPIENATKFENKNVYFYFQLPVNLKQLVMTIAVAFFREKNVPVEWPGGRRAKLPAMPDSN